MKQCPKCKEWKDKGEFGKNRTRNDKLRAWCKKWECQYFHDYYRRDGKRVKRFRKFEEYRRVVDGVKQKHCNRCKRWKPEAEFHKLRTSKDGLYWYCKKCTNEEARKYRERRTAVRN